MNFELHSTLSRRKVHTCRIFLHISDTRRIRTDLPLFQILLLRNSRKTLYLTVAGINATVSYIQEIPFQSGFLLVPMELRTRFLHMLSLFPCLSDSVECINGKKPSILMNNNVQKESEEEERTRWLLIAEKVEDDLVLAYERAKTVMEEHNHELRLVALFGKIFFYGRQAGTGAESSQKPSNKMFSDDVPTSYLHHIKSKLVPSHGFCIDLEKERYTVKVSHYTRPNVTINCKCTVREDGRLSMYKVDLNSVRHLVVDVSCIHKNLDMRLMLSAKRKITALTEKEISSIKGLLDSATVDPNVKGGLRWPLGKSSSGDGYRVFEACHVRATVYKNQTLRLRLRETDRFNERIGAGKVKREVTLMLKDMNNKLKEQNIERGCVLEMLRDALGTLWDFLHCDAYLT